MIKLTKENIDSAIVSKGNNIVNKFQQGYILTDETLCTFNSLMIFKELFNNKCKMLDAALENLYYIADRLVNCDDSGGGGDDDKIYYVVNVNTNPDTAIVTINGITTKSASLLKGSSVQIVAKLSGYYDKTYTISNLQKDTTVNITFTDDDKKPDTDTYTITVNAIPTDAVVKINGQTRKTAVLAKNSTCNIEVSRTGYQTYTNSFVVTEDKVFNITLEEIVQENITITVRCTPSDAEILMNGLTTDTITVEKGSSVRIQAYKEGYEPYDMTAVYNQSTTVTIVLNQSVEDNITLTVNTIPAGAAVYIDGVLGAVQEVRKGSHTIVVSKTGYETLTINNTYYEDTVIEAKLKVTLTVNTVPSDANVTIDGSSGKVKSVYPGEHSVVVSKQGYYTVTRVVNCVTNTTINVTLEAIPVIQNATVRVITTQDFANVVINGEPVSVKSLPIGTEVSIRVYATGYTTWTKTFILTEDVTEYVTLKNTQTVYWNIYKKGQGEPELTQGITAYFVYNDDVDQVHHPITNRTEIEVEANREITTYASASGYNQVQRVDFISGNYSVIYINIPLVAETQTTYTLTINPTPADAVVELNDVVRSSITVVDGSYVKVSVTKQGYVPYEQNIQVTEDRTINVVLEQEVVNYRVIVNTTPADAVTTINNVVTKDSYYPAGTELTIVTSKSGYVTDTRTITLNQDETINIVLNEIVIPTHTLTVVTSPSDAITYINGSQRKTIQLQEGQYAQIETSKQYYENDQRNVQMGNSDITEYVNLTRKKVTVTVNATPLSASPTIKINNVVGSSRQVDAGSTVTIEVSAQYYQTVTRIINVEEENITVNINLVKESVKLFVKVQCNDTQTEYETADVVINGVQATRNSNGLYEANVDASSIASVVIYKQYYVTNNSSVEINDQNKTVTIVLQRQTYLLTVNTVPSNAIVYINNILGKTKMVPAGKNALVVTSATGYITDTRQVLIENSDKTILIELEEAPSYTLTVNVLDADTLESINNANVTFNIE